MSYVYTIAATPVGALTLVANEEKLVAVLWENDDPARVAFLRGKKPVLNEAHPVLVTAERQLGEYFRGERKTFDLALHFEGTDFQKQVWRELTQIPFGQTKTYSEIARKIGRPAAVRAVGAANGRNPISIIAACHRVIGADGNLTGFAGGLETKAYLLDLEAELIPNFFGNAR